MVATSATSFEERVGRVLLDAEFITSDQLDEAREKSNESGDGLLDTLVTIGTVARETLMTVLSFQLRIPVVDLKTVQVDMRRSSSFRRTWPANIRSFRSVSNQMAPCGSPPWRPTTSSY